MSSPDLIPQCSLLGRPTGVIAKISMVTKSVVTGYIQYGEGLPIPFETCHDHVSFQVGKAGPRFYFQDWKKIK